MGRSVAVIATSSYLNRECRTIEQVREQLLKEYSREQSLKEYSRSATNPEHSD